LRAETERSQIPPHHFKTDPRTMPEMAGKYHIISEAQVRTLAQKKLLLAPVLKNPEPFLGWVCNIFNIKLTLSCLKHKKVLISLSLISG
jgi:hypothetical protein